VEVKKEGLPAETPPRASFFYTLAKSPKLPKGACQVWGEDEYIDERTVNCSRPAPRTKLGDTTDSRLIETVRGSPQACEAARSLS